MPSRFTARILEHLSHDRYEASTPQAIARDMRVPDEERPEFEQSVNQLASKRQIAVGKDGLLRLPPFDAEVIGTFRLNPRGFGFVIPDRTFRDGDLFIPAGQTSDAISGDKVRATVTQRGGRRGDGGRERGGRSQFVGRIVEVIQRGQEHFVGTLINDRGRWFVKPDGRALFEQVLIRDPHSKMARTGGAKAGDKVVFELVQYPEGNAVAEGVITKVLGEAGRPDVETQAVIIAHDLRTDFPDEVIEQARRASHRFDDHVSKAGEEREDLTKRFVFTIDPPDAKDFDDAISIRFDAAQDRWELGVHIADVSSFVTPGNAMDDEAKARGNSVYLPRLVLPMLPEVLSNGVCSLQEGVPRLCLSAFITLNSQGKVLSQRLARTIIQSSKRLTYLEAQALIDGKPDVARENARTDTPFTDELVEHLKLSDRLAKIIQRRRRGDGMIVLNLPEVDLVFDDQGHVIDAKPEDDSFTHKLIEMFMVEANEAVARTFADLNVPLLRRIHPEPVHGDIEQLRVYALAAHQKLPDHPTRQDLQRLLEATANTPASKAIHFAVLRTLTKAVYSPALIGHFALASDHYAHFTSPIRRYPDLSVHRTIAAFLDETDNGQSAPTSAKGRRDLGRRLNQHNDVLDEEQLVQLGKHCSQTERAAEEAERELRSFLVLQFLLEHHMGGEFPGVVTGMSHGGLFVSIEPYLAEGMVRMTDMPQAGGKADRWTINERTGRMVSGRSGASVGVGDIVRVQIVKINLPARQMDLMLTKVSDQPTSGPGAGSKGAPTAGRRREPKGYKKEKPRGPKTKSRPPRGKPRPKRKGR